ncbi:MAG: hypothetical protein AAF687_04725 [Pseudomonadota bacterium]
MDTRTNNHAGNNRASMAAIAARAHRDASNMIYVLGISLSASIAMMSVAWIVPSLWG